MSVLDGECSNVSHYPSLKGLCVRNCDVAGTAESH